MPDLECPLLSIEKFEDILAWQKARLLTREVYRITRDASCHRDFRFCSQLQSASVSVMSNIAEGFERRTPRQFAQYLLIAKASCAEVRSLLYVGLDAAYVDMTAFNDLMGRAQEVARLVSGLRKSLRSANARNSELGTRNPSRA